MWQQSQAGFWIHLPDVCDDLLQVEVLSELVQAQGINVAMLFGEDEAETTAQQHAEEVDIKPGEAAADEAALPQMEAVHSWLAELPSALSHTSGLVAVEDASALPPHEEAVAAEESPALAPKSGLAAELPLAPPTSAEPAAADPPCDSGAVGNMPRASPSPASAPGAGALTPYPMQPHPSTVIPAHHPMPGNMSHTSQALVDAFTDSAIADSNEMSAGWHPIPFTGSSDAGSELPLPGPMRFTGPVEDDSQLW